MNDDQLYPRDSYCTNRAPRLHKIEWLLVGLALLNTVGFILMFFMLRIIYLGGN